MRCQSKHCHCWVSTQMHTTCYTGISVLLRNSTLGISQCQRKINELLMNQWITQHPIFKTMLKVMVQNWGEATASAQRAAPLQKWWASESSQGEQSHLPTLFPKRLDIWYNSFCKCFRLPQMKYDVCRCHVVLNWQENNAASMSSPALPNIYKWKHTSRTKNLSVFKRPAQTIKKYLKY